MLTCYLDEAGGLEEGFTVVGGFGSTLALWEQFEIDWKLLLAAYKVPYFHMKEFSQSTGPFKKWKGREPTRKHFIQDASAIIKQRAQWAILCFVHHTLFDMGNKTHKLEETLFSPYAIAGRVCVAQVGLWYRQHNEVVDTEFIFEDGGPDKGGLQKAMDIEYKCPAPIFKPSRDMKDKRGDVRKGIVQLQAADFMAYELRKHRREFSDKTGRPARKSFEAILAVRVMAMASFYLGNSTSICQLENPVELRI